MASVAQAEGVSLGIARRLLQVVAGAKPVPGVARPGRAALEAGRRAGALIEVLDEAPAPGRAGRRRWDFSGRTRPCKSCPDWPERAGRVRAVWRASRLVECVHGVARMPRARHREMTQGLRDRKGLSRTLRRFRAGHRKGETPHGLRGLKRPEMSFGASLKLTPDELREPRSAQDIAP